MQNSNTQNSNTQNSIVAYFPSSGQVDAAGDQLRSLLQITDSSEMQIEQVTQSASADDAQNMSGSTASSQTAGSMVSGSTAAAGVYKMTVTVPQAQQSQAMEIIRSQGGTV